MRIILSVIISSLFIQVRAQKVVMLHKANGLQRAFYGNQPLVDAYEAASHEDTIYLPGGVFISPNIGKRLKIYGAGHYPDSSMATGKTIIANGFTIGSDADSLLLEGIEFNGDILVGSDVNYLVIRRSSLLSVSYNYLPVSSYNRIEGNVIKGNISTTYAASLLVVNNIMSGQIAITKNGDVVRNNVFLLIDTNYPIYSCYYTLFENNIFLCTLSNFVVYSGNDYNTFSNNVFTINPIWSYNTNNNNYLNAAAASLFVNQTGNIFSYQHNYHLQNPGTFLGVDATQCGIYGGSFVYKEGAVPVNPHIRQKSIAASTDANGKLNVNITVAAQNN